MFLGVYRFTGKPEILLKSYDQMLQMIPHSGLHFHACVPDADGLFLYDSCPTREIFLAFSNSPELKAALGACGLPSPVVTPVGEIHAAFVAGKRTL